MSEKRTIRVIGKGRIKLKPDMTRITFSLKGIYPEYEETVRKSSEVTEQLKDLISNYGFKRSDLKTLYFNIDTEYENYRENDVYKQRLVGYRYSHTMKLEFESDQSRLGKILFGLAHCNYTPEFRISYTVKDSEAAKNQLLAKAVQDAREKADVLSKAAGVELKDILSIDYSWGEIEFAVHPTGELGMCENYKCLDESYDLDIEPDDIDVSDTVTVVWEIL